MVEENSKLEYYGNEILYLDSQLDSWYKFDEKFKIAFDMRMDSLKNSTNQSFMKRHYTDSTTFNPVDNYGRVDALMWLSYSDAEKKKILDKDLEDYFKV